MPAVSLGTWYLVLIEPHILKIDRLAVDPARRRCDPVREFARLDHLSHQGIDVRVIFFVRHPLRTMRIPFGFVHDFAVRADVRTGETADRAMEADMRQRKAEGDPQLLRNTVPSIEAALDFLDVVVA